MLVNLLAVGASGLSLPAVWSRIDWRRYLGLAIAAVPGVVVGAWLALVLSSGWLEIVIGMILALGLLMTFLVRGDREIAERPALRAAAGGVAGVMSSAAGAGGPAVVAYAALTRWPFPTLTATTQPYFVTVAVFALVTKLVAVPERWPTLDAVSWMILLGALVLGAALARLVGPRIPERFGRVTAFAVAGIGALSAIVRGAEELL